MRSARIFSSFKPLVLAVHVATVAMASSMTVHAATVVNIAAGDLVTALNQYALQSNVNLILDGHTLTGFKTQGLQGQYEIEAGFNQLLGHTPYQIKKTSNGYALVARTQPQKIESRNMGQLNMIDVTANATGRADHDSVAMQLPVITVNAEDEKSYTVKSSKAATKLDLSLKETPQSVTVFTRQQIEDQNLNSASAILEQTPGVTTIKLGQQGVGVAYHFSRGFEINNYSRDGIPTSDASFGGGSIVGLEDSAIYERIEVIKGATGLTSGSGNPSASLNFVRKRPTENLTGSIRVQAGTWDNYRSEFDVSGALNNDASIRGRTVAVYEQGGNQQERYHRQNAVIYGALDFDLSDKTILTTALQAQQVKIDDATVYGFPFVTNDNPQQKQTTFVNRKDNAAADFTYGDIEKVNLFVGLEHQLNENWQAVANYAYTKAYFENEWGVAGTTGFVYDFTYAGLTVNPGEMGLYAGYGKTTPQVHALDLYVSGDINALGRGHNVSFGLNGYSIKDDSPNSSWGYAKVPIAGWNGTVNKPDLTFGGVGQKNVDEIQLGAFAATKLQILDPLKLIVGSRFSNWERKATGKEQKENAVFTPYAGLVFDINHNFSIYGSYTSIFTPSSNKNVQGDYLDPQEGNNLEAGIKAGFYDGRLNLAAAYFDMQQDNFAIADGTKQTPDGGQAYIAVDGTQAKGYELSISGEILPNWYINAGYTHTDAKDRDGKPITGFSTSIPEDTLKLFTSYQWDKLTLGAGVNWQSDFYGTFATTPLAKSLQRQNHYWLVNLMGRYQIQDDISISLNLNNVLDEKYLTGAHSYSWGAGRNFTASLMYKF